MSIRMLELQANAAAYDLIAERNGKKITLTNNDTCIEGEYDTIAEADADILNMASRCKGCDKPLHVDDQRCSCGMLNRLLFNEPQQPSAYFASRWLVPC